jgi:hypothetical protein
MTTHEQKIQSRLLVLIAIALIFGAAIIAAWLFLGEVTGITVLFFLLVIGLICWRFLQGSNK